MVSLGVFYKHIQDHIYQTASADEDPREGRIANGFENADAAYVLGLEVNINKRFDFLPAGLSGFGFNGNYSYIHSEMETPGRSIKQPLTRQADHIINASLYYEKFGLRGRVGLNWRSDMLYALNMYAVDNPFTGEREIVHDDTDDFDIFLDDFLSLDVALSYGFKEHWTVFAEFNNLANWPWRFYRGSPERPVQVEFYSVRGLLGLKYSM
jgi:TonB-dependent receptor